MTLCPQPKCKWFPQSLVPARFALPSFYLSLSPSSPAAGSAACFPVPSTPWPQWPECPSKLLSRQETQNFLWERVWDLFLGSQNVVQCLCSSALVCTERPQRGTHIRYKQQRSHLDFLTVTYASVSTSAEKRMTPEMG